MSETELTKLLDNKLSMAKVFDLLKAKAKELAMKISKLTKVMLLRMDKPDKVFEDRLLKAETETRNTSTSITPGPVHSGDVSRHI